MVSNQLPYLIAGLGNPGRRYRLSRHNIGFKIIDAFAEQHGERLLRVQNQALVATFHHPAGKIILVKPQTMMNNSGRAVAALARFYQIPFDNLLVVFDDLDLPAGKLRLRPQGGSGGHRGMRSIIELLGSQDFPRLRVGIGRPPGNMDPADYVLQRFSPAEEDLLPILLGDATDAIEMFLAEGIEAAMTRYNNGEAE